MQKTQKKLITTAISYPNGPPHIGHSFEWILSDFISRWERLKGVDVNFLTGTDEHGQKIEKTAYAQEKTPKQLCDENSAIFKKCCSQLDIDYTRFIRTTDQDHRRVVYEFFERCKDDIYLGEYTGWYNTREETFVLERDAKLNNYKDPVSGDQLTKVSEPSYFFRLSKYQEQIKEYLLSHPDLISPPIRLKDILLRLETPLDDLSISRVSVKWGIPVPENPDHTFYVWFDALINYISGSSGMWPAYVHVIGKDIAWFHTVIWFAMLMSAKWDLPEHIFIHGFVCDSNGQKMSKSIGNVVSPDDLIKKYPVDAIRSYLIHNFSLENDFHFCEKSLVLHHDSILLSSLGNLVNRTFGLVHKYSQSRVPKESAEHIFSVTDLLLSLDQSMDCFKLNVYSEKIFNMITLLNTYVNDTCIWQICNEKYPDDKRTESNRQSIIRTLIEGIYIVGCFIAPIIPNTSQKICTFLNKPTTITIKDLFDEKGESWNVFNVFNVLNVFNTSSNEFLKESTILYTMLDNTAAEARKVKHIAAKK
jgi:methionyl-tRNA synthetase